MDAFLKHLGSEVRTRIPGTTVVLSDSATGVPPALVRLVQRFHVLHEHVVLLTVVTEHVPFVPNSGRATVEQLGGGLLRVFLHYGFMQVPRVPAALAPTLAKHGIAGAAGEIAYIMGRETLVAARHGHMGRLTEPLFAFLARNARSTTGHFSIPVEQVIEVGIQLDL